MTKTNSNPRYKLVRLSSTGRLLGFVLRSMIKDQRRMNCIAARAPRKNTVGIPRVCKASQRTVKIG